MGCALNISRMLSGDCYLQSDPIGLEGGINTYAYVENNPVMMIDPEGLMGFGTRPSRPGTAGKGVPTTPSNVWLCKRPVDLAFVPNAFAAFLPNHMWVKTPEKSGGMGGQCPVPGQQCSDVPYSDTSTKDHSNQSGDCEQQRNVNQSCVNDRINIGAPTGPWTPTNQCHTYANGVVDACRF